MKYLGWIIAGLVTAALLYCYQAHYRPLRANVATLEREIAMWEEVLRDEQGLSGDRNRFPPDRFFEQDRLTPYAEVEILRRFDLHNKGIEIYVSAPHAIARAQDILRFLNEQHISYGLLHLHAEMDSVERFEYKYIKVRRDEE